MHWLEVTAPIEFKGGGRRLEPGVAYAMDDHAAAQMLGSGTPVNTAEGSRALGQVVRLRHAEELDGSPEGLINMEEGGDLLVHRSGGIGDLLLLTPALRAYKRRYPKARILVCTMPKMQCVLERNPHVDRFVPWPPTESEVQAHDAWVFYENIIENNLAAREVHAVDLYARQLLGEGLAREDRVPELHLSEVEKANVVEFLADLEGDAPLPRVGIQVKASTPVRTWPAGPMSDLIMMLLDHARVVLFGAPGEVEFMGRHKNLINLSAEARSFRQSCAILAQCDALVAPDSAMLHAAAALGVPSLGLFGPFPSALRLTSSCQQAIDAGGLCAPCFHHSRAASVFPQGSPCSREARCHVLGSIPPAKVFAEVMRMVVPAEGTVGRLPLAYGRFHSLAYKGGTPAPSDANEVTGELGRCDAVLGGWTPQCRRQ